jgi:cell division transport system permease protein
MGPRWRYLVNEVGIGLRRNLLMTLATVVTVTVSLTVLGVGLLTGKQIDKANEVLYGEVEVSIFLDRNISDEQRGAIEADLADDAAVEAVIYESQQQAFENAREIFAQDRSIIDNLQPQDLPASFRVKLFDPEQYDIVQSQYQGYPGVEEVVDQGEALEKLFGIMEALQDGAIAIALLQGVGAAALIFTTIRIAAFARREQTGIMKLVGATNWYIRLPFMLEGLTAALVGALIATAVLLIGEATLLGRIQSSVGFFPFIGQRDVLAVIPLLMLVGVLVAGLASFLSLRRFLNA